MPEPSDRASTPAISDEFLRFTWDRAEAAKHELEQNWTYQMIAVAVALGLIFSLGDSIQTYLFDEPGHEQVLYIVLPFVLFYLFYLFMRFGPLIARFKQARQASDESIRIYATERRIASDRLVGSNSFFEVYLWNQLNPPIMLYILFVPVILSANHAASAALILKAFAGHPWPGCGALVLYAIPVLTLYITFNRVNEGFRLVRLSTRLSWALTGLWLGMLVLFERAFPAGFA